MTSFALFRGVNGDSDRARRGGGAGDVDSGILCFISASATPASEMSPR